VTVGLDTSVVLRLLIGSPVSQATAAVAFLDDLNRRGDRPVMCDMVVAETYYALQHHYGVRKADAITALRRLFADGEIASIGAAADVLSTPSLATAKPGFVDRLIHRAYLSDGARMATFERSSARLSAVVVVGR
jgi:predicted nucleic acid-binding protein